MGDKLVKWGIFSVVVSLFPVIGSFVVALLWGPAPTPDLLTNHGELFIMASSLSAAGIGDFVYERLLSPRRTATITHTYVTYPPPFSYRVPGGPVFRAEIRYQTNVGWRSFQLVAMGMCVLDLFAATMAFASMPPQPTFSYETLYGSLAIYFGGVVSGLLCIVLAER